jgi:PhnB protein
MTQPPNDPNSRGPIPYIIVDRAAEAVDFYRRAFDGVEVNRMDGPQGQLIHCQMAINGGGLMISDSNVEQGVVFQPSNSFHLQLVYDEGVDEAWQAAVDAGCEITSPLQEMFWGDRYGSLRDPFGINWAMNCPIKRG